MTLSLLTTVIALNCIAQVMVKNGFRADPRMYKKLLATDAETV